MFMSIDSFRVRFVFGDRHYTRKGRSMLFLLQISLKNKVYERFRHKKNKVVFDTTHKEMEE